jgi:hypothetical protein
VGVSRKCCRLCWLLKDNLNNTFPDIKFVLPGTHATFYPWIPPAGIPDEILKRLRDKLIEVIRTVIKDQLVVSYSRQSSGADSNSEPKDDDIFLPLPLQERIDRWALQRGI